MYQTSEEDHARQVYYEFLLLIDGQFRDDVDYLAKN